VAAVVAIAVPVVAVAVAIMAVAVTVVALALARVAEADAGAVGFAGVGVDVAIGSAHRVKDRRTNAGFLGRNTLLVAVLEYPAGDVFTQPWSVELAGAGIEYMRGNLIAAIRAGGGLRGGAMLLHAAV